MAVDQSGNFAIHGTTGALTNKFLVSGEFVQFQNSGNSMFSLARHLYTNSSSHTATKKWKPISSGEKTYLTGSRMIGKSSIQSNATVQELSFRSQDTTSRNSALIRCRAGGCIAPKKKTNNY